jgi:preprotein translocase subunit SecE
VWSIKSIALAATLIRRTKKPGEAGGVFGDPGTWLVSAPLSGVDGARQGYLRSLNRGRAPAAWTIQESELGILRTTQRFVEEVQVEMRRVTWPDREQLRNATAVILVFVLILAFIIGAMDAVFSWLIRVIVGIFSG